MQQRRQRRAQLVQLQDQLVEQAVIMKLSRSTIPRWTHSWPLSWPVWARFSTALTSDWRPGSRPSRCGSSRPLRWPPAAGSTSPLAEATPSRCWTSIGLGGSTLMAAVCRPSLICARTAVSASCSPPSTVAHASCACTGAAQSRSLGPRPTARSPPITRSTRVPCRSSAVNEISWSWTFDLPELNNDRAQSQPVVRAWIA